MAISHNADACAALTGDTLTVETINAFAREAVAAGDAAAVKICDEATDKRDTARMMSARRTNIVLAAGLTVTVSTVHLVFDHGWGGERLIFETMAFLERPPSEVGTPLNDDAINDEMDCCRYATLDEARAGHDRMVQRLKRLTHLN